MKASLCAWSSCGGPGSGPVALTYWHGETSSLGEGPVGSGQGSRVRGRGQEEGWRLAGCIEERDGGEGAHLRGNNVGRVQGVDVSDRR